MAKLKQAKSVKWNFSFNKQTIIKIILSLFIISLITCSCSSSSDSNNPPLFPQFCTDSDNYSFEITSPAGSGGSISTIMKKISITGTVPAATGIIEYQVDGAPYAEITNSSYINSCKWIQEIDLTGGIKTYAINVRATYGSGSTEIKTLTVNLQSPAIYYVDFDTGNDSNSGTSSGAPWKHCPGDINATANADTTLAGGDIVVFKGGVKYKGTITSNADGESALNPIVYDGDTGTYAAKWGTGKAEIDGSEILAGTWAQSTAVDLPGNTNYSNIWYLTPPEYYTEPERTIYEDDQFLWFSQYPKPGNSMDYDDPEYYKTVPAGNITGTGITDPEVFNQPDPNYWDGATVLVYHTGNNSERAAVSGYIPAENRITFDQLSYTPMEKDGNNFYSIIFHKNLLTQPGEYYYDPSANRIYIWPVNSDDPNTHEYTVSKLAKGFNIKHSNIVISGFKIGKLFGKPKAWYDGMGINCINDQKQLVNLLIENNEISMNRSMDGRGQIFVSNTDGALIKGNSITNIYKTFSIFASSSKNIIVENNRLSGNRGTGILFMPVENGQIVKNTIQDLYGTHSNSITIYMTSNNNLVAHNYVSNSPRPLTIERGSNYFVYGNVFDSQRSGNAVADWDGCTGITALFNNSVIGRDDNVNVLLSSNNNKILINNILDGGGGGDHRYNIYTNLSWDQDSRYGWYPGEGEIIDYINREDEIYADFDNSDSIVDYSLTTGSPAINAGTDIKTYLPYKIFPYYDFDVDIDGNPIHSNGSWNIGAYGFSP